MYGSSFIIVTRRPRASRIAASDAAAMPFPSEDTTPPVTKMSGVAEPEDVMGAAWLETRILAAGGCDGDRRAPNGAGSRPGWRPSGTAAQMLRKPGQRSYRQRR